MMMKEIVLLLGVAMVTTAMPPPPYYGYGLPYAGYYGGYYGYPMFYPGYPAFGYPYHAHPVARPPFSKLAFHGTFKGNCDGAKDGLYYVDDKSFAFCTHGQKTLQPCAEGSANPPMEHFKDGSYYGFYEFCSVNLVARGYPMPGAYFPSPPVYQPVEEGYGEEQPDGYLDNQPAGYYDDTDSAYPPPKPVAQTGYTEEVHSGYAKEELKYPNPKREGF